MMATAAAYDLAVRRYAEGQLDWENDQFKVMLLTSEYVPQQSRDASRADVRQYEVEPSGTYQHGGALLKGCMIEDEPGVVRLAAGEVSWTEFSGVVRYAVVYQAQGEQLLIAYTDFRDAGEDPRSANASFSVNYGAGVCEFEVAAA